MFATKKHSAWLCSYCSSIACGQRLLPEQRANTTSWLRGLAVVDLAARGTPALETRSPLEEVAWCWPLSAFPSWQSTANTSEQVPLLTVISTRFLLRLKIKALLTLWAEKFTSENTFRKAGGPAPAGNCQNKSLYYPTVSSPETRFMKEKNQSQEVLGVEQQPYKKKKWPGATHDRREGCYSSDRGTVKCGHEAIRSEMKVDNK